MTRGIYACACGFAVGGVVLSGCGQDVTTVTGGGAAGGGASTTTGTTHSTNASNATTGSGGDGGGGTVWTPPAAPRVLLFSKTAAFRHASIPDAVSALQGAATARGWLAVQHTEDGVVFTPNTLAAYDVVVFLLTSGDVLDASQQAAFEAFIQAGGGYVGVHSASDTEYDWPWYGGLVGAYFAGHPAPQTASIRVERERDLATSGLSGIWQREDEWYSFDVNPREEVVVLLSLDEGSYGVGEFAMGDHPIAWQHAYDGGRAFYSALGHTSASWQEADFVDHIAGGIEWANGGRHEDTVISELDGTHAPGDWQPIQSPPFDYTLEDNGLTMTDAGGANQHLVRQGASVDPTRAYVMEALFQLVGPLDVAPNSFAFNLNMDDSPSAVSTWSINVDIHGAAPGGVMKHMGFNNGVFASVGETVTAWGEPDVEYLLRVHVDGTNVTAEVFEAGSQLEQFQVDYTSFQHQPGTGPVRVGANTHGTDWKMRSYRVYYAD